MISVPGSRRETGKEGVPTDWKTNKEKGAAGPIPSRSLPSTVETDEVNLGKEKTDPQGCDLVDPPSMQSSPVNFADQLRDIDSEIQKFQTTNFAGGKANNLGDVDCGPEGRGSIMSQTQDPERSSFNDTQTKSTKTSWKKITRTMGQSPSKLALTAPAKCSREAGEDELDMDVKKWWGPFIESRMETILSAEAVT
jgi:hypothetical protein